MARFVNDLFRSTGLIQDRSDWLEVQMELGRQSHGMLALKRTLKPSNKIFHSEETETCSLPVCDKSEITSLPPVCVFTRYPLGTKS